VKTHVGKNKAKPQRLQATDGALVSTRLSYKTISKYEENLSRFYMLEFVKKNVGLLCQLG
jgi:hypothetical protein